MGENLAELRKEIDKTDLIILKFLKKRFSGVLKLSGLKKKVKDARREKEVLERIKKLSQNSKISPFAVKIFKNIIKQSLSYQKKYGGLSEERNFKKSVYGRKESMTVSKGANIKAGLLGYSLKKTLSPAVFDFLCLKTGFSGEYLLFNKNPLKFNAGRLSEFCGLSGLNVTAPFKEIVAGACSLKGEAEKIKAVNAVKISGDNFTGRNTDILGFENSLKENKIIAKNQTACVWGTGGGAKAVVFALIRQGAKKIFVFSRKKERALKFAVFFRKILKKADIEGLENSYPSPDSTGIFISAVSPAWRGSGKKVFNFGNIKKNAFFMDLAYSASAEKTRFLKFASSRGAEKMIDGRGMLFYQAVGSFEFWTGIKIKNPFRLKKEFFKRREGG